jgi:hypothetical protein
MDSESFEEILLEILSFKLTKGYTIGETLLVEDLFHGAYMSPNLKKLMFKTRGHVAYVFEQNCYYNDDIFMGDSEITLLYPNSTCEMHVGKDQFEKYIFKAPKDDPFIDGRAFVSAYGNKVFEKCEFLFQMKQKKEMKDNTQITTPSPREWAHMMDDIIQNSCFTKTLPIKVFMTSAKLDGKECKQIVESVQNMIILDKSGLKKFLSSQLCFYQLCIWKRRVKINLRLYA